MKTPAHTRNASADEAPVPTIGNGITGAQQSQDVIDAIRGFSIVNVTTRKGDALALEVLDIPLLEIDSLARVWGQLNKEAELYVGCGLKKLGIQFSDLTSASQAAAVKEGRRINRPTYQAYLEFQQETVEAMGPEAKKIYQGILARAADEAAAKPMSVPPPSPPGPPVPPT
jgi:hypothetical protein